MENTINPNSLPIPVAKEILGEEIVAIAEKNSDATLGPDGNVSIFALAAVLTKEVLELAKKLDSETKREKSEGEGYAK